MKVAAKASRVAHGTTTGFREALGTGEPAARVMARGRVQAAALTPLSPLLPAATTPPA